MVGGVPARPLPRPQDAGQTPQRQQKDQHDQVSFLKFGAIPGTNFCIFLT